MIVRRALDAFGFIFAFALSEALMLAVLVLLPVTWIGYQVKKMRRGKESK